MYILGYIFVKSFYFLEPFLLNPRAKKCTF
nr:MAG TPA: hypothetical protein [Caudoviricetes sp.]